MDEDRIDIVIAKDGLIRATTDPISDVNHVGAEGFLELVAKFQGTEGERVKRGDAQHHHHHHHHAHTGHGHDHNH